MKMKTNLLSPSSAVLVLLATLISAGCGRSPETAATSSAAPAAPSPVAVAALPNLGAAPDWELAKLDGTRLNFAELAGKVVVIDFWATWCGPCVKEIPGYIELQRKYAEDGVVFVGISVDDGNLDRVRAFSERYGVNYPMVHYDNAVIGAFGGIEVIPTTFLIDRDGNIRHRKLGAVATAEYEALIVSLL